MKPIALSVAVAAALTAMSAGAQGQAEAADPESLEEVIVTAQKREQNILDVPIAISAVPGQRARQSFK